MWSVGFSPDGQRVFTGCGDGATRLWDAVTGRPLLTLKGHTDWVTRVAFSRDGLCLVTGSNDRTARIWEAASPGQVVAWRQEETSGASRLP